MLLKESGGRSELRRSQDEAQKQPRQIGLDNSRPKLAIIVVQCPDTMERLRIECSWQLRWRCNTNLEGAGVAVIN